MYPEPYYDRAHWLEAQDEILRNGFAPDYILPLQPDLPVYGLNIAMGWPLPVPLKESYEKLFQDLLALGPDIYVYPYEQTHITIMTLVNFKNHKNPKEEDVKEIKELSPKIIELISKELHNFKSFKVDIGWPVLFKSAAILPILNPTGEIFQLRKRLDRLLTESLSLTVEYPKDIIHSTFLRFLKKPTDPKRFMEKFESIAVNNCLGGAPINELLLTSETKPYMRGGEILHRFRLGD